MGVTFKRVSTLWVFCLLLSIVYLPTTASSVETRCLTRAKQTDSADLWTPLDNEANEYKIIWQLNDPEQCLKSISKVSASFSSRSIETKLNVNSSLMRSENVVTVQLNLILPLGLIESFPNRDLNKDGMEFFGGASVELSIQREIGNGKYDELNLAAEYDLKQFWMDKFAKKNGTYGNDCYNWLSYKPKIEALATKLKLETSPANGNPTVSLNLSGEITNCIDLIYTGPLADIPYAHTTFNIYETINNRTWPDLLSKLPFWSGPASVFFKDILSSDNLVQVFAANEFSWVAFRGKTNSENFAIIDHKSSISRSTNGISISLNISRPALQATKFKYLYVVYGTYYRQLITAGSSSSGWKTACSSSGKFITCKSYYNEYREWAADTTIWYFPNYETLTISEILKSDEARATEAAAELKKQQEKQQAEELKQRLESERLARQVQECIQQNVNVKDLFRALIELKYKYPTKFRNYWDEYQDYYGNYEYKDESIPRVIFRSREVSNCDSYGKGWIDQNSFTQTKSIWLNIYQSDLNLLRQIERAIQPKERTTITCVKGKTVKKITAVNPKCPSGYKKK